MSDIEDSASWWKVAGRLIAYEGELRAGVMRVLLVSVFYAIQLSHFLVFSNRAAEDQSFHRQVTYIAAVWLFVSLITLVAISRYYLPSWLKYFATSLDLVLVTLIAATGAGPASPIIVTYWIVIALAGLRGDLRLIWFTSLMAMGCYWGLVGMRDASWFDAEHATAPVAQLVTLVGLGATGVVLGQMIRLQRAVINDLLARLPMERQNELS
jgi:hypothetical protein